MPQSFDVAAARRDGIPDREIAEYLAQQNGFNIAAARSDGIPDGEIISFLTTRSAPSQSSGRPGLLGGLSDAWQSITSGGGQFETNMGNVAQMAYDIPVVGGAFEWADRNLLRYDADKEAREGRERTARAESRMTPERRAERERGNLSPQNILHGLLESTPAMAPSIGAGIFATAATKNPMLGLSVASGVEGAQAAGGTREDIYQTLTAQGYSEEEAHRAALLPALGSGIATGLTGRFLMPGFEAKMFGDPLSMSFLKGLGKGSISEGAEEAVQSGSQQIFSNIGVGSLDETRGLFDDVGKAVLHGAVLGAAGGAAFGGVGGLAGDLSRRQPRREEVARGRAAQQLNDDIMMAAMQGEDNSARAAAIRAAQVPAAPQVKGSLPDKSAPGVQVPPTPAGVRQAVDQVTWREKVAPILDEMAMGNYDALLAEQQERQELIQKRKGQKKKAPQPLPDPVVPRPESQLKQDPFTPEMGAELIRSAEAGPMTASMLKDKGIPKPKETLQILERRGFLKKTGMASKQVKGKDGKSRTVSEPIYESTAVKPPEVARAGETAELTIKPIPVETPAQEGRSKGPSAQAVAGRTAAARERVADLRRQLLSLPQVGEDWSQSRIDAMDSRRKALEEQLQQAEFEAARAQTGRAGWAVVEKIQGAKLDGRQGLDFVNDPSGAPRENVVHTFPTRKEAENWIKAKQGQTETKSAPKDPNTHRNARIQKKLKGQLDQLGIGEKAQLKIASELGQMMDGEMVDPEGFAETAERDAEGRSVKMLIALARDIFDPNLSEAELMDRLASTLNHEAIHAIRSLGLFKPAEWNVLAKETRSRKKGDRDYTYLQWAHETYKDVYVKDDGNPDMDLIVEEAVAEMFKDWRADGKPMNARYTGLLNKIEKFLRALLRQMTAQGVMAKVDTGEVGSREAPQPTIEEARAADEAGPEGVPPDRRFMFAGKKSERAPMYNLEDFLRMEEDGEKSKAEMYFDTGWYRGKDKQLRYEISDKSSHLILDNWDKMAKDQGVTHEYALLGEVLDHRELFAAYPDLKEVIVNKTKSLPPGHGYFDPVGVYGEISVGAVSANQTALSIILHEVQHAIQFDEDFALGGSPDQAAQLVKERADARRVYESSYASVLKSAKEKPFWEWVSSINAGLKLFDGAAEDQLRDTQKRIANEEQLTEKQTEALKSVLLHNVYEAIEGEVEARNTEKRKLFDAMERTRIAPWRTRDVSEGRGIVIRATHTWGMDKKFSMAPRMRNLEDAVPGAATQTAGGKGAAEMAARYTVVQDSLAKGMRINPFKSRDPLAERDLLDRVTVKMQDRMFPVRRLISETLKSGGKISDAADPILADTLYPRRSQHRLEKAHSNLFRPAFIAMQAIGATRTELSQLAKLSEAAALELESDHVSPSHALLNLYMYARHAPERNAFIEKIRQAKKLNEDTGEVTDEMLDAGSGMTNEEAAAILAWFDKYSKLSKVKLAAQKADAILAYTRKIREESGLSPKWDEVDSPLVPKFEHYVPLRGVAMGNMVEDWEEGDMHARTGKAYKIGGREDPRMKGRQTYAGDMMAHIILQANEAVIRSEKVKVGQAFAKFVRANQHLPGFPVKELPAVPKTRTVDSRTGKVMMSTKQGISEDPRYFTVKENGQVKIFEIDDPKVARAMTHIQSFDDGPAGYVLSKAIRLTRLMSQLQTSFNPEFLIPNFMRDVQAAMIQSGQYDEEVYKSIGAKAGQYAIRAGKDAAGGGADMEMRAKLDRLAELGGLTGVYGLTSIHDQIAAINNELKDIGQEHDDAGAQRALRQSAKAIGAGFKYLESVNDAVESATRLAVFESFIEKGWSEERAAQAAKDMTVNFNRKGEWGPYFNAAYMFFNAATQGTQTMLQTLTSRRGKQVVMGLVLAGALQELLMSAISPEDEYGNKLYDKIEPHILEKNLVIMTGKEDGSYIKIPMPLGYNIFHSGGRNLARVFMGKEKPLGAALDMGAATLSAFNPFGSGGNILTMIIPSIGRPVAETIVNEDFTGRNIHPEGFPGQQPPKSQAFFPQASEGAQGAADLLSRMTGGDGAWTPGVLEVHPDDMDHLTASYLGGLGRFLGRSANVLGFITDPQSKAVQGKELRARDVPFYRAFAGNVSGTSVRGSYDDLITPYLQVGKSFDQFEKEGNYEAMQSMMDRDMERISIYDYVRDMERDRIKTRRSISEVQKDPFLDDAAKVQIIKQLRDEEQMLMNMTIRDVRQMEKEMGL